MHAKIVKLGVGASVRRRSGPLALATALALIVGPALADATADEKAALDLQKAGYDTAKAGVDAELDAIKQLQSITGGNGDATAAESSAEGLLLAHYVYDGLANRLASALRDGAPADAPIVIFGSTPPTTADLIGFNEAVARLSRNLADANRLWEKASDIYAKTRPPGKGGNFALEFFSPAVAGPIAAIASVADLFTVDTTYKGAAITVKDEQFDTQLAAALAAAGVRVDFDAYQVTGDPAYVTHALAGLEGAVATARRYYLEGYMPLYLKANGKTSDMDGGIAAAGKNLETVLGDYDSARKALFTPAGGVLPATTIDREYKLQARLANRRILYIRNHKAAVTTDIRKGFFIGWFKPPVHLTVAAIVDYVVVEPDGRAAAHSLGCASRRIYLMDVATLDPGETSGRDAVCLADHIPVPVAK